MLIKSQTRELFVPRVVTVAFEAHRVRRTNPSAFRAVVRCNMRSAINAANYNRNLPRLRQVLGY